MNYGYARVSTNSQKLDRQIKDFLKLGISTNNIFSDKESGKDFNRINYKKLMKKLKPGDTLFIKSIDRLGRNYNMIIEEWRLITKEKDVNIVVVDMPLLDTRIKDNNLVGKLISDIVLQILSFVAENEREAIKQRQAEGIRIAMLNGVKFGRPRISTPENFNEVVELYKRKEITISKACELCGLSRGTFYRNLNQIIK